MYGQLKHFTVIHDQDQGDYRVVKLVNGQTLARYPSRLAAIIAAIRQEDQIVRQIRQVHSGKHATKSI